jgi:hypothetical protein
MPMTRIDQLRKLAGEPEAVKALASAFEPPRACWIMRSKPSKSRISKCRWRHWKRENGGDMDNQER